VLRLSLRPMTDNLNIVTIRPNDESPIVIGVILGTDSRRAVVFASSSKSLTVTNHTHADRPPHFSSPSRNCRLPSEPLRDCNSSEHRWRVRMGRGELWQDRIACHSKDRRAPQLDSRRSAPLSRPARKHSSSDRCDWLRDRCGSHARAEHLRRNQKGRGRSPLHASSRR